MMKRILPALLGAFASLPGAVPAKTLLYLPVSGDVAKDADVATVDQLFRDAVQAAYPGDVKIAPADTDSAAAPCAEKECAARLAAAAGADEAVYATVKRLGAKWIFSATRYDAATRTAANQRGTATALEDLEGVTKRVSDALMQGKTVAQVANLDNLTGKEIQNEPERRRSLYNAGFALGYLFPAGKHSYAYLTDTSRSHGGCDPASLCAERQRYSQMVRLAYLNAWEFRDNLVLGLDLSWAMPNVLGADIGLQYLFTRTDFSPFLGAGAGIQYVSPLDDTTDSYKRNSGPALNAQAGLLLFRTYDIHLQARAQYQWVFNEDLDQGMVYDVGVIYRPDRGNGSGWGNFWKFFLAGAVAVAVVGVISD